MSTAPTFDASNPESILTSLQQLLGDPTLYPDEFKRWLTSWMEVNPPTLPIDQISGASGLVVAFAAPPIPASEGTGSSTYVDLTTVGPTISGLPDGVFQVGYGASARAGDTAHGTFMSLSVNGAAPDEATAIPATEVAVDRASIAVFCVLTLANDNQNTLTCKYRVGGGGGVSGNWQNRWLVATRMMAQQPDPS